MESYSTIYHRAAERHGGEDALHEKIMEHHPEHNIPGHTQSDDRWLAEFTKRIFQAGFSWKVVDSMWDGFETAFWKFDIARCARIDMDDMESLTSDKRIVRNGRKIKSVPINAQMIRTMREEKGSVDAFIRGWASEDFIGLLEYLQKNGSNLGVNTACYALRFSGVPSFILSKDVTVALIHAGVIDKPATSKGAKKTVQAAFNAWTDQSGQDLTYVSRVLAMSIDAG